MINHICLKCNHQGDCEDVNDRYGMYLEDFEWDNAFWSEDRDPLDKNEFIKQQCPYYLEHILEKLI